MKRQTKTAQKVTKGQLALVGVLGVILIGVIASNLRSADQGAVASAAPASDEAAPAPTPAAAPGAPAAPSSNPSPFGAYAADQNWAKPKIEDLVRFDPLSDGSKTEQPVAPKYDAAAINELRNAQDAIVFTTDGQTVARIGAKEYHVGDVVGGMQIREISSAGIVLGEPN
jgi:hypothetical protein